MDEKTIQRIKKLQALAERGVGGEKTTAQKKLAKLLKDNGINSLDELQKEEYEYTIFSYNGKHEIKLLRQCMYKRMNNVSLTGRLTREPELRYGGQDNSTAITRFTLAVDDGKDTDFINIKCFGRTAEWAQKWLSKGSRVEVTGKIKTGSYESQRTGSKVYYTEVVANSVGFGESKAEAEARGQQLPESDGFMNIPEGADEELPFN